MSRRGFTLIELLVVIVILAVLMAIAIPTLLGQRNKARDADTKSDITNAYRAMKAEYVEDQGYTGGANGVVDDTDAAIAAEPQLTIEHPASSAFDPFTATEYSDQVVRVQTYENTSGNAVNLEAANGETDQVVALWKRSKSGTNFGLIAVESDVLLVNFNRGGGLTAGTIVGNGGELDAEPGVFKGKATNNGNITTFTETGWN